MGIYSGDEDHDDSITSGPLEEGIEKGEADDLDDADLEDEDDADLDEEDEE